MSLPKSLQRICFRCKCHIMYADNPVPVLVNGVKVSMHEFCAKAWDKELETMSDKELMGTENVKEVAR